MKLSKNSFSPSEITKVLEDYIKNLPDGESKWKDFYRSSVGKTTVELLAGVGSMNIFYELMGIKEGSLLYAQNESSINQLAINRGVFRKPATPITLAIDLSYPTDYHILKGQVLGSYKEYLIYSLDNYSFKTNVIQTIKVVIGELEEFTVTKDNIKTFYHTNLLLKNKYGTSYLEELFVNAEEVIITDEQLPIYDTRLSNTILRISNEYNIKLIAGNGKIGRLVNRNDEVRYRCLTFNEELITEPFSMNELTIPNVDITKIEVLTNAVGLLDKESLRLAALRASYDGRWVSKDNYTSGLLLNFGEILHDVLVIDEYPVEKIILLPNERFTINDLDNIHEVINKHKGNAVKYEITKLTDADGFDYECNLVYSGTDNVYDLVQKVIKKFSYKIYTENSTISESDIALELSKLVKTGQFYLKESNNTVTRINKLTYLRRLIVNYTIK